MAFGSSVEVINKSSCASNAVLFAGLTSYGVKGLTLMQGPKSGDVTSALKLKQGVQKTRTLLWAVMKDSKSPAGKPQAKRNPSNLIKRASCHLEQLLANLNKIPSAI